MQNAASLRSFRASSPNVSVREEAIHPAMCSPMSQEVGIFERL